MALAYRFPNGSLPAASRGNNVVTLVHSNVRAQLNPPSVQLAKTARILTDNGRKALAYFAYVLDDPTEPTMTRLAAASLLLDRGFGKAPQHIEVTTTSPSQQLRAFSLDELVALRDAMARAEAIEADGLVVDVQPALGDGRDQST